MANPRWIPGMASPNPSGRPPGSVNEHPGLSKHLRDLVDPAVLAEKLYSLAKQGYLPAIKYIYDRLDGRPKETIETHTVPVPKVVWFSEDEDEENVG